MVKAKLSNTELQIARAMYDEGLKMWQIAKIYGISKQALSQRFKSSNIPRRKRGRPRKR
jgi:DNA-directed RNA polymerase specialized sigma subunit